MMMNRHDNGADNIASHLCLLAGNPKGGAARFRAEAEQIIERQEALQADFRALTGYGDPLPYEIQAVLDEVYGVGNVRTQPLTFDQREIDRVAYNLWVLAKMPKDGPEPFRREAMQLIAKRSARDRLSKPE